MKIKKKYTYESPMEGFDPICHLTESDTVLVGKFFEDQKGYEIK